MARYDVCPAGVAQAEYEKAHAYGASMLCYGAPLYPQALYDLSDPPPLLWAVGRVDMLNAPIVALVGARNASIPGRNMARRLARELGEAGLIVASGLARGIDRAAHEAAIETGTLAVLAGGVDVNYPSECADIAERIRDTGLVLSEAPFGQTPTARHFPPRNRIISGISDAVVVVEGAAKSGSLITARNALDQGRDVMAVPGSPLDARAAGCNMLIRDGATLVRGARDVLEVIEAAKPNAPNEVEAAPVPPVPNPDANALRKQLLDLIGTTPIAEDALIQDLSAPTQSIVALLSELELMGEIERLPGGAIARKMSETG